MRNMQKSRLVAWLLAMIWIPVSFAQPGKPKVAVKTFQNPATAMRSTIGDALTEILVTEIQNTGKFSVLERVNVDELTREMDFGETAYAKSASFAKKGNLLGAQYILMGKVTNFAYQEQAEQKQKVNLFGPNTIETIFQQRADVRVDFRLVDVSSGETIIAQAGEARKTNTSRVSELQVFYGFLRGTASITVEGSSSLIGKATVEAVKDIVAKLNTLSSTVRDRGAGLAISAALDNLASGKGAIVAEAGSGLWIIEGLGLANGLQKGDRLKLTHDNVVKDKSGKVVYRKPVEIGVMEVTDVSQQEHAEVRYMADTGAPRPQIGDMVVIDIEYARNLRGAVSGNVVSPSSKPETSSLAGIEQVIKRAESYLSDGFWAQALEEFDKAAAVDPGAHRILQGKALSRYMLGDFLEADELADRLLQSGGTFSFPVAHYHSMGLCSGKLSISRGKILYSSDKGDGFEISSADFGAVEARKISPAFMVNEKPPSWTILELRWRGPGGEKKYQLLPAMFSKQPSLAGKNLASAYPMDDAEVRQMQKFEQSMSALIGRYMK